MTTLLDPKVQEIISYWFEDATSDPVKAGARGKFWYGNNPAIDQDITERFQSIHEQAAAGKLAVWEKSPKGALALVIVLDQFSRNIYRGKALAFAADDLARKITARAIASGADTSLHLLHRIFLYHPFHHSEQLAEQDQVVCLYSDLKTHASPEWQKQIDGFLKYAIEHRDLVARFGRFPHRNSLLGRQSTAEETLYLEAGASRYGQ